MGWLETRRIPVLLAAATLLPIGALCWLGMRTLDQERELERQRRRERLEVAAGRVALDIERQLQAIEARLTDGVGIRLHPRGISSNDGEPVLFQPTEQPAPSISSPDLLLAAEQEYQHNNVVSAATAYRRLSASRDPAVRGAALVALGGLLRRQGRYDDALDAYADLEQLGVEPVAGGIPAALVARQGRGRALESQGDTSGVQEAGRSLAAALYAGGWAIDRATFDLYREMAEHWGGPPPAAQAIHRTEIGTEIWRAWRLGELAQRGRRLIAGDTDGMLALWLTGPEGPTVALVTPAQLELGWRSRAAAQGLIVQIADIDGRPLSGTRLAEAVRLSPDVTKLPFLLTVSADATDDDAPGLVRRRILMSGLALALALTIAASYGLYRITTRELMLARQQTDFVSAVSHEFRTPLTSLRHLTDLLVSRNIASEERKAHYYQLLAHETDRLHRMVETLLSFGRIEAGQHAWRQEPVDVKALVCDVVDEFSREAGDRQLRVNVDDRIPSITVDREALSRALWNLLENAAKYSSPDSTIDVFARANDDYVLLGVQDRGVGIHPREQQRIFQKFVRGEAATQAGVRGVGIGLALVTRIVEAHGGSVRLESEAGRGSTFTLVIPCHGS